MTSVGRGRGWATSKNRETILRRPGSLISEQNPEYRQLIEAIDEISVYSSTPMSTIDEIESLFRLASRSNGLRAAFDALYEQALEDRQFGMKLAKLFTYNKISDQLDEDGTKLRSVLLSRLQSDYEKKDETKDKSMAHYLNAMSLLGEVFYQVRLTTGRPLTPLGVPLLDYMTELLQSASEEDIKLVATQLSLNGKKIYASKRSELEEFFVHVRTVLINRNLSSQSRAMLLLAVDLANQFYEPLSGDLQAFYLAQLGEDVMTELQRYQSVKSRTITKERVNNDNDDTIKPNNSSSSNFGIGLPAKSPTGEKITKTFDPSIKSNDNNCSLPQTINPQSQGLPRAIRGLGIRDNNKKDSSNSSNDRKPKVNNNKNKDKLTDEQVWSSKQNNSSKSWGHDDRFDRDYEQDRSSTGGNRQTKNNTDNVQSLLH